MDYIFMQLMFLSLFGRFPFRPEGAGTLSIFICISGMLSLVGVLLKGVKMRRVCQDEADQQDKLEAMSPDELAELAEGVRSLQTDAILLLEQATRTGELDDAQRGWLSQLIQNCENAQTGLRARREQLAQAHKAAPA